MEGRVSRTIGKSSFGLIAVGVVHPGAIRFQAHALGSSPIRMPGGMASGAMLNAPANSAAIYALVPLHRG
jgi:hypothetical protein